MRTKFTFGISLFISIFLSSLKFQAQTYFQKVYINPPYEQEAQDVVTMPDGGYLMAGYTTNSTPNDCNVYIIKTDAVGAIVWTKTYGGAKPDFPYHLMATNDGNYFLIGYSQSYGPGDLDMMLMKIDPAGNLLWTKTYGGSGNDQGKDIIATADGNYVIVGSSNSPTLGNQDANLIKIDPAGNVIWSKFYGGAGDDFAKSVKQCADGTYIILGQTFSYGQGGDTYLIKTDANGDTTWTKHYGGALSDEGIYIDVNSDNSFTFVVRDSSNIGKDIDVRIMKTDNMGNVIWSKVYGGNQKDTPKMIQPTSDGGYIVASHSRSFGWINPDMWILKFNSMGDTTWTRHYGGPDHEHCYTVRELADGSYIACGKTASYGPDLDAMFIKLNSNGTMAVGVNELAEQLQNNIRLYPNPNEGNVNIDLADFQADKIIVTDVLGREVYMKEFNKETKLNFTLNTKNSGIYFVKCESETRSVTKKFIIN